MEQRIGRNDVDELGPSGKSQPVKIKTNEQLVYKSQPLKHCIMQRWRVNQVRHYMRIRVYKNSFTRRILV